MKVKDKKAFDNALASLKALLPELNKICGGAEVGAGGDTGGEEGAEGGAGAVAGAEGAGAEGAGAGAPGAEGGAGAAGAEGAATGAEGGEGAGAEGAGAAGAEGAGAAGAEGANAGVTALVTQVEALLAQLKAAMGGETAGATDEGSGEGEGEGNGAVEDNVEGLQGESGVQGAQVSTDAEGEAAGAGQGKASPGPAAGKHSGANDAALRGFYADLAAKTSLYNRVSKVTGAFDHAAMDSRQVAAYGVKHPSIALKGVKPGQEFAALDSYLTGREHAAKSNQTRVKAKTADSAAASSSMDAYLNGSK